MIRDKRSVIASPHDGVPADARLSRFVFALFAAFLSLVRPVNTARLINEQIASQNRRIEVTALTTNQQAGIRRLVVIRRVPLSAARARASTRSPHNPPGRAGRHVARSKQASGVPVWVETQRTVALEEPESAEHNALVAVTRCRAASAPGSDLDSSNACFPQSLRCRRTMSVALSSCSCIPPACFVSRRVPQAPCPNHDRYRPDHHGG